MVETIPQNSPSALLNLADVNQHSGGWIDRPSENKISHVVSAAAIPRVCLRAEHSEVFLLVPILDAQSPRGGKFKALTDGEEHKAANTLQLSAQIARCRFVWSARTCPHS